MINRVMVDLKGFWNEQEQENTDTEKSELSIKPGIA